MTSKLQQRKEAESIKTNAWQARFAHLNHSGIVSRCKDWAVVIHIRNVNVDGGSGWHHRNATVYCLDKQGVSRHLSKHTQLMAKKCSTSFLLHPLRSAVGSALLICWSPVTFTLVLKQNFWTSAPLTSTGRKFFQRSYPNHCAAF